jgi:hypothetical protein
MRIEINQHLHLIDQIYTLYPAGATALFMASMSKDGKYSPLFLVPFLSLGSVRSLQSYQGPSAGLLSPMRQATT